MLKTSGYTGAIVVAAVLVTPAFAQTPVPDGRPRLTLSLQIVVSDDMTLAPGSLTVIGCRMPPNAVGGIR